MAAWQGGSLQSPAEPFEDASCYGRQPGSTPRSRPLLAGHSAVLLGKARLSSGTQEGALSPTKAISRNEGVLLLVVVS